MVGKKLMIGPSLTLHQGWQVVPLDATRSYGPKKMWLVAKTAADVTLSTDARNEFILKSGYTLVLDFDGAPFYTIRSSDMVENGNFSTTGTTGAWTGTKYRSTTGGTGWAIGGGSARHNSSTGAYRPLGQTLAIAADSIYEIQYDVKKIGTGATGKLKVTLGGSTGGITGNLRAGTDYTECVQTRNATGPLRFYPANALLAAATGFWGSVDNVSVKKITGTQLLFAKGTSGVILQVMFTI
jgi:hypothetical protein